MDSLIEFLKISIPVITAMLSLVNFIAVLQMTIYFKNELNDLDSKIAAAYFFFNYLSSFAIAIYLLLYYKMYQSEHHAPILIFLFVSYSLGLAFNAVLLAISKKKVDKSSMKSTMEFGLSVGFLMNLFLLFVTAAIFRINLECECHQRGGGGTYPQTPIPPLFPPIRNFVDLPNFARSQQNSARSFNSARSNH